MDKLELKKILAALGDVEQPLTATVVNGLSGLTSEQLSLFETAWGDYPIEQRRAIIQHLNLVSEANFEMDFHAINHLALTDADPAVCQYAIKGLWEDKSITLLHKLIDIVRHAPNLDVRIAAVIEMGRFILLGEYEEISIPDAQLAQEMVLQIYNSDEDNELRRRALEAIANCGRDGVHEMISDSYRHSDLDMRVSAVFAMGRSCDQTWGPELLEEMNSDEPALRYEAILAAGHMELHDALPQLARMLEDTDDVEILEAIIWALGEIGGEQAKNTLNKIIAHAESEGDDEILAAAQDALDAASLPGEFLLFDFEP